MPVATVYVQRGHADARAGRDALKLQVEPKVASMLSVHASALSRIAVRLLSCGWRRAGAK